METGDPSWKVDQIVQQNPFDCRAAILDCKFLERMILVQCHFGGIKVLLYALQDNSIEGKNLESFTFSDKVRNNVNHDETIFKMDLVQTGHFA